MQTCFIQVLICLGLALLFKAIDAEVFKPPARKSILFPDGEGKLHKVALSSPKYPVARSWFVVEKPCYWLYTRNTRDDPELLSDDDPQTLTDSQFDPAKLTKFVTHGWHSDKNSTVCVNLKNTFLDVYDCNVIIIDWSASAKKTYYFARMDIEKVAPYVGRFLDFLVVEGNTSLQNVHLLGHSLGGHLVGLSSRASTAGKPKRLTALDPALPLFQTESKNHRLDKSDGPFVEVIHTSGGILGFMDPLGHADFYVNGGTRQPGCGMDPARVCAHMRAHALYAELIRNPGLFTTRECDSMGEAQAEACHGEELRWIDSVQWSGIYLLETSGEPPFIKPAEVNYYDYYDTIVKNYND